MNEFLPIQKPLTSEESDSDESTVLQPGASKKRTKVSLKTGIGLGSYFIFFKFIMLGSKVLELFSDFI